MSALNKPCDGFKLLNHALDVLLLRVYQLAFLGLKSLSQLIKGFLDLNFVPVLLVVDFSPSVLKTLLLEFHLLNFRGDLDLKILKLLLKVWEAVF